MRVLTKIKAILTVAFFSAFAINASITYAAIDTYTVTGGNPGALPNVGSASVILPAVTITEDGLGDDFSDNEVVRLAINTGSYPSVKFDSAILAGTLTIGGTCGYTTATNIAYSANDTIADITIDDTVGNDGCAAGETISIAGMQIETLYATSTPGAAALVSVDNTTTNPGAAVSTTNTINLAVLAADAAASLTLADATVGATQNTTLTLTIPLNLANGDTITFTMPSHIEVVGTAFVSTTFAGTGFTGCSEAGQVITCTVDTDLTAGTANIVMSGMSGLYVAAAANEVSDLAVNDTSAGGADIAVDTTVDVTDTVAFSANADVVLGANSTVGISGNTTLLFTTPFALDPDDTIDIVFPAHIDVSAVDAAVTGSFENGNEITCAAAGQTVTCTVISGPTLSSGSIIMTGITSSAAGTDDVSSVEVEDEGVASNDIAADITVPTTDSTLQQQENNANSGNGGGISPSQYCALYGINCPEKTNIALGETNNTNTTSQICDRSESLPFEDVIGLHWSEFFINELYYRCIVDGRTSTLFAPDEGVTRAELTKIAMEAFLIPVPNAIAVDPFPDVDKTAWYARYIEGAKGAGLVDGYDNGLFGPNDKVTRAQAMKILLEAANLTSNNITNNPIDPLPFKDVEFSDWFYEYVYDGWTRGIVSGYSETVFGPNNFVTRGEASKMAAGLMELVKTEKGEGYIAPWWK